MSLFGFTNPEILNWYPKETPSDGTHSYNGSWVKRMDNFEEIKEKFVEYPRVNETVIPDKFNDFTINCISANYKPEAGLFSNLHNFLSNNEKQYSYGQEVYTPSSYPQHFINTNNFYPLYSAEMNKQDNNDEFYF